MGEVQTNDEAQEDVHDLDLFVTVQILDDTPAVLSPGKLRDEQAETNVSGSAVNSHGGPNKGRTFYARRKISYLWSFLDYRVRLLHRHRRTRQEHRQVHHQVHLRSEVTSTHQETGRGVPQGTEKIRMTVCEIFQSG